jgi:membrane-anchored glycerophosphoryl diester phosphodiesterase (GDPDase)
MNFNFGEILTRAWQIIWKHRILWIFGILASCSRGGGGGGGGGNGSGSSGNGTAQLNQWISGHVGLVILLVIILIILILLFAFLGTIGKIGLIKGTYKAEQGADHLIFGELFSESVPYFGRVFGLGLLLVLVSLIIFIPIFLIGILTAGIGFACLLPLICILIPALIVVGIIIEQANNAMVLEELGIKDGVRRGWEVVRSNLGPVILMAVILGVISIVIGLIVAIPILIVVIPAVFAYAAGNAQSNTPLIVMGVCICLYLPFAIVLQGILTAYIQSAWTLTYMRLTSKPDDTNDNPPAAPKDEAPDPVLPEDNEKTIIASKPNA